MTRSTGWLLVVLTALGLLVSAGPLVGPAAACSCASFSEAEAVERSDAVFVGTLLSHEVQGSDDVGAFEVLRTGKGEAGPRLEVAKELYGPKNPCGGQGWTAPGTYQVFASRSAVGALVSGGCSRTGPLTGAQLAAALASLPPPAAPVQDETKGLDGPLLLLSFTTLAGVVGFLTIVRRHRRRMRERQRRVQPRTRPAA